MDFKNSIKTFGWLIALLVLIGIAVLSSMGAINYGGVYIVPGALNLVCWAAAIWKLIKKLIEEGKL